MKWQVIFYRNISGQCPTEKFINGLPYDDAEEIVAAIAALRELGNKARRPLADYLEDGIYELRARRLQRRFRVLYTFVGKETIMDDLDRIISKKEREKPGFAAAVERRKGEILIAARLRKAREKLKLTQREVADRWSISQQSISKIENARDNHISLHTLNEYARVLGYELHLVLKPQLRSQ